MVGIARSPGVLRDLLFGEGLGILTARSPWPGRLQRVPRDAERAFAHCLPLW